MLYLEDESRSIWPEVVRALVALEPLDMVLCAHVGDSIDATKGPFKPLVGPPTIEVVTTTDGEPVDQSQRVSVDEPLLSMLECNLYELEDWGDSFLVGRPGDGDWIAAWIPHEGMVLAKPEFRSALAAAGYRLSDEAPDWW